MPKIVLKFNDNPPISTYNHHGFGTGIIATNKSGYNWLYNNYINLTYCPEFGPLTFEFYMDYIYCQPVFDREYISDSMLKNMKYNIIGLITDAISQGKYFICCVDEYYIPDREAYGVYHYDHNMLIYGVDTNDKTFYTAGYDSQGKFSTQILNYKTVKSALPHNINVLSYRDGILFEFDKYSVERQIRQYNGESCIEQVGCFTKEGRVYGYEAVDRLLDDISSCMENGENVDIRPICLLYDHRKLMAERMNRLSEGCSEYVTKMVSQVEILKKRILIYNVRHSEKDSDAIQKLIEELRGQKMPHIVKGDFK